MNESPLMSRQSKVEKAQASQNRYKNPWYKSTNIPRPEFYENSAPQVAEYRQVKIYKLFDRAYDFVLSGMCITQRAGITEHKCEIDSILDGRTPVDTLVCKHLRKLGHKPISYPEYTANWRKIDAMEAAA